MKLHVVAPVLAGCLLFLAVFASAVDYSDLEAQSGGHGAADLHAPSHFRGRVGPLVEFISLNTTHFGGVSKRAYSVSVNPTTGASGATFRVTYTADTVSGTWIGLFQSGSTSTSVFKYVNSNSGYLDFSNGLSAGTYAVYLVGPDGYIKAQATYTVTGGSSTGSGTSGSSTTTGTTPSGDPTTWVNAHNAKRRAYGMPDLAWSTNLQNSAQNYANILSSSCSMVHSGGAYGENLAMGYQSIDAVMGGWVDSEAQYWSSATRSCSGGVCGHFTQVLWRTTSYVGCGIARCANGYPIYVCQYLRPGNCNGYDYTATNSPCGPMGP